MEDVDGSFARLADDIREGERRDDVTVGDEVDDRLSIRPGSVGEPREGRREVCIDELEQVRPADEQFVAFDRRSNASTLDGLELGNFGEGNARFVRFAANRLRDYVFRIALDAGGERERALVVPTIHGFDADDALFAAR